MNGKYTKPLATTAFKLCKFCYFDFRGFDFKDKNLDSAHFYDCLFDENSDFRHAKRIEFAIFSYCPTLKLAKLPKFQIPQGKSLIGWKALLSEHGNVIIAKLRIPTRAKRTRTIKFWKGNIDGRKCRAEYAIVEDIFSIPAGLALTVKPKRQIKMGRSQYDHSFVYEVGKKVKPKHPYDNDIANECKSGIHFFLDYEDAVKYAV